MIPKALHSKILGREIRFLTEGEASMLYWPEGTHPRSVKKCVAVVVVGLLLGLGAVAQEVYIVASDIPWAPFEMVNEAGEFLGFDLDLMRAIAHVAGFQIEIKNIAFDAIIENVRTGRADIGASGFTITAERDRVVDFSIPYFLSNQAVLVRKDSGLNIVTALAGDLTGYIQCMKAELGL